MEHLIAIRDINDRIKSGDRFDAPDQIYVALGFATVDQHQSEQSDPTPPQVETVAAVMPRRRRGRHAS